ncbi:MAG: ABC transporter permease [Deltaproteobacteria bacterium]|nr:ABC transporter permease [Deltaproteobacteria bacterium]MBW2140585.1 ABC transporter permease [Deltaproteobacteria bacterium]MBW2323941.1 ABC transporter permease [Deltaproteobacteria bacterium]
MAAVTTEEFEPRRKSNVGFLAIVRTLFKHRLSLVGIVIIVFMFSLAIFAPVLAPYDPLEQDLDNVLKGPSIKHWLGTDDLGRDLLSRVIYGAQVSMTVGVACTVFSLIVGTFLGLLAGFKGGKTDQIIMRLVDMVMIFPGFIFILILAAALGPGMINIIIAISLFGWAGAARIIRGNVLSTREEPYVDAARAAGASQWRIMFKHVLPNSAAPMIVAAALGIGGAVGMEAGAAFLGIGVQPPTPSWGRELRIGYTYLATVPLFSIAPGMLITLAILAFTFLADGLRDALDPRIRGEGKKM